MPNKLTFEKTNWNIDAEKVHGEGMLKERFGIFNNWIYGKQCLLNIVKKRLSPFVSVYLVKNKLWVQVVELVTLKDMTHVSYVTREKCWPKLVLLLANSVQIICCWNWFLSMIAPWSCCLSCDKLILEKRSHIENVTLLIGDEQFWC